MLIFSFLTKVQTMNQNRLITPILALITLLILALPTFAAGPVEANLMVENQNLTVGDPIQMSLAVTHPAGYVVIAPELDSTWGDFLIQSQSAPTTILNPDGSETTTIALDARLFAPGSFSTPPLSVSVTDGAGNLSEVAVAPIPVEIASVLVEGDTELRDIKPQADMPLAAMWPAILGGLVAAIALIAAAILWLRNRKRDAIDNRLPHERAFDELDGITALHLPEHGQFKEHYTLVSDCIRQYMEATVHVPVLERTTSEIRTSFRQANIPANVTHQFVRFLDESDLVKFSTFTPDVVSAQTLLALGHDIVEMTMPQPETENTPTNDTSDFIPNQPAEVTA